MTCTDGSIAYCSSNEECYATETFDYGQLDIACRTPACRDYMGGCSLLINSEALGCDAVIRFRDGGKSKIREVCNDSCNNCDDPPECNIDADCPAERPHCNHGKCSEEIWITSCSESSARLENHELLSCVKAFDGNEDSNWCTKNNEAIGAWIRINLDGVYRLTKMMVKMFYTYPAKDVSLEFSNGVQVDSTLDFNGEWQTIDLMGIGNDIITNYANISVNSIYSTNYQFVIFSELKVFGYASNETLSF